MERDFAVEDDHIAEAAFTEVEGDSVIEFSGFTVQSYIRQDISGTEIVDLIEYAFFIGNGDDHILGIILGYFAVLAGECTFSLIEYLGVPVVAEAEIEFLRVHINNELFKGADIFLEGIAGEEVTGELIKLGHIGVRAFIFSVVCIIQHLESLDIHISISAAAAAFGEAGRHIEGDAAFLIDVIENIVQHFAGELTGKSEGTFNGSQFDLVVMVVVGIVEAGDSDLCGNFITGGKQAVYSGCSHNIVSTDYSFGHKRGTLKEIFHSSFAGWGTEVTVIDAVRFNRKPVFIENFEEGA